MFYYTLFSSVLWMVVVMTGALLQLNGTIPACHFKLQNNIEITETICPPSHKGCIIRPTPSSEDITALPGTKIRYKCINSFPEEESSTDITTTCDGHRWLPPISQCDLITTPQSNPDWSNRTLWKSPIFPSKCGMSTIETDGFTPSVRGGNKVKLGEFPWHAGVYDSKEESSKPICGATIIASQYLLSAAHCFTEITNTARIRNHTEFYIMFGKLKSRNDVTEDYQQRHEIKHIFTDAYRGRDFRYQKDIAIIRTRSEITFNSNVSPICMINDYFPYISENTDLWVAGWGYFNSSPIQSEDLMSIKLPYISYDECSKNPNYEQASPFLTTEKFCTVRDASMRMSLDKGDSGGGLVTKGPNNTYYLIGIVSLSNDGSPIAMCTYVPQFHKWIFETTLNYHIHLRNMAVKPRNTVCGQLSQTTKTPPTTGTYPVLPGKFPWHAGVYEKSFNNTLICGATIISSYTLLSAAHCVVYETKSNHQTSTVDCEIRVGEIERNRLTARSETTAIYQVESLIFNNYQGFLLQYERDIVIIVTKTEISFNSQVSPICMFQEDSSFRLASKQLLQVVHWNSQKNVLEVGNQPYIRFQDCYELTSLSGFPFLSSDKFCTGTNETVITIDRGYGGSAGSGLVLRNSVDFAYYLVGIRSLGLIDEPAIAYNTDVSTYLPWIHKKLNQIHKAKNETFSV